MTTIYIFMFFFLLSLDDRIVSYLVRWVHLRTLILLSSGSLPIITPTRCIYAPFITPSQSLIDTALFFFDGLFTIDRLTTPPPVALSRPLYSFFKSACRVFRSERL
jgi:hypothetical protein